MLSTQKAARGKPVYGGGTYAPNTGRVSAQGVQGYVEREQRNNNPGLSKFGRDGKSDTRSGLASKALAASKRPGRGNYHQVGGQQHGGGGGNYHEVDDTNTSQPSSGGTSGAASGGASLPSQVIVNDAGTLQLPYDDQWSQDIIGAMGDYNSELLQLQQSQQQQAMEYMNQSRGLNQQYDQTKRDTLNVGAGSGAAFSSAYGSTVAKNALNFQNDKNSLETQNSQFNQNAEQQRAAIQQAFQEMLRQDALARAQNAAQDAGSLGYGASGSSGESGGSKGGKDKGGKSGSSGTKKGGGGGAYTGTPVQSKPRGKQRYHNEGRTATAKRAMKGGKK